MKRTITCNTCGEEISTEAENIFQDIMMKEINNIQFHFHVRKHGKKGLKFKSKIKYTFKFLFVIILLILCIPIYAITYPFWWVHERLSNYKM